EVDHALDRDKHLHQAEISAGAGRVGAERSRSRLPRYCAVQKIRAPLGRVNEHPFVNLFKALGIPGKTRRLALPPATALQHNGEAWLWPAQVVLPPAKRGCPGRFRMGVSASPAAKPPMCAHSAVPLSVSMNRNAT